MKKWLAMLFGALLIFAFVLAAQAEDETAEIQVINADVVNGEVSGSYYYLVRIVLPESAENQFQMGWASDPAAEEPSSWSDYYQPEWLYVEEADFTCLTPPKEGDIDVLFVRLNDQDSHVQRLVCHYDKSAVDPDLSTSLLPESEPELQQPYTLKWAEVGGADLYHVHWTGPNGDTRYFATADTEFSFFNVQYFLGTVGSYQAWVVPLKDGKIGVEPDETQRTALTISAPEADPRVTVYAGDEMTPSTEYTMQVNESSLWRIEAPGALDLRFYIGNFMHENVEMNEQGIAEWNWELTNEQFAGGTFSIYAMALFDENEGWVMSNVVQLKVTASSEDMEGQNRM